MSEPLEKQVSLKRQNNRIPNKNPYKVGVPVREQTSINAAVLSGAIGPEDWKANNPMTQKQADQLFSYRKQWFQRPRIANWSKK